MKYMIPEAVLILMGILFTQPYIDVCIYAFKIFHQVTSLEIFTKLFLAFPFVTLLIFFSIGCVKKLPKETTENQSKKINITNILKQNFLYLIILIAFLAKIFEAVGEAAAISPYWIVQYGSFDLLLNMIGLFCISSVMLHLFLLVKNFLKN